MKLLVLTIALVTAIADGLDDWDKYRLVWEDNFNTLDSNKWEHEITAWGGGNQEFQVYTPDSKNSYVRNGLLHIKPTLLQDNINPKTGRPFGEEFLRSGTLDLRDLYGRCTFSENGGCLRYGRNRDIPPTASARLRTATKFSFTFGRAEIRAKMPAGDWLWPAMWLLPERYAYGPWPRSGELDMVETRGNRDLIRRETGKNDGIEHMGSTLHWGVSSRTNRWYLTAGYADDARRNFADHFHIYTMDWDANRVIFYVDDQMVLQVPSNQQSPNWRGFYNYGAPWNPDGNINPGWNTRMAPFDKDFHFILNVAVGGCNGFMPEPEKSINRGGDKRYEKPWRNTDGYVDAMNNFYNAKDNWYWTWEPTERENSALQVDYVRVYQGN